jgi:uncharacterized protein YbjQ (UPF0145 family)
MKDPAEWEARRQTIRDAVREIYGSQPTAAKRDQPVTSDLSIDEGLILHSIGWEPVDLVCGASVYSIPQGSWVWAIGEIEAASYAATKALEKAADRLEQECRHVGGAGVIGVQVGVSVEHHAVNAVLVGTAVVPGQGARLKGPAFVSDLSARDFVLLHNSGWEVCGLAYGTSFVHVPRRTAGAAMKQASQNVELTNFTEAMYSAREAAMERMQSSALQRNASGVVAVQVSEGPMEFATHAIGFTAWGTAVRLGSTGHKYVQPRVTVTLDDSTRQFDAASLRG